MGVGIEHYLAPSAGALPQVLRAWLSVEEGRRLIGWGAVYAEGKRGTVETEVEAGAWIRIHRKPKRFFPLGGQWVPWKALHPEFIIAYKPAGIPMHASLDNLWENLQHHLEMECDEPLFTGGRLDVATQGLVALGRCREFIRRFHDNKGAWQKRYRALVSRPVPPGRYVHHMDRSQRYPYWVTDHPTPGSVECILEIHASTKVRQGWELDIELVTGRTHQIRTQLAALGSPICGDRLYGIGKGDPRWIALQCYRLHFEGHSFEWDHRPWTEK